MSEVQVTVGDSHLAHATDDDVKVLERELRPGDEGHGDDDGDQGAGNDDGDQGGQERSARESGRDVELDEATTDTERKAIQERRRIERQRRKQNNRDRMDATQRRMASLENQNRQMAEQLRQLANTNGASQMAQLDSAIAEAANIQQNATAAHASAVARADGQAAAEALQVMLAARDRFTQLSGVKDQLTQTSNQPSPINPIVRKAATDFASRNRWYKGPHSNDPDSQVLSMLDNGVAKDGFDPTTQEYWDELEDRASRYLPHRFGAEPPPTRRGTRDGGVSPADDDSGYTSANRQRPRPPVAGAGQRGNAPVNSEGEFRLSAERVTAMKEAGIWEDPKRRQKMIAEYRKIDQQQGR